MQTNKKTRIVIGGFLAVTLLVLAWTVWDFQKSPFQSIVSLVQAGNEIDADKVGLLGSASSSDSRTEPPVSKIDLQTRERGAQIVPSELVRENLAFDQAGEGKSGNLIESLYALFTFNPRAIFEMEQELQPLETKEQLESFGRMIQVLAMVKSVDMQPAYIEIAEKYRNHEFLRKNILMGMHDIWNPGMEVLNLNKSFLETAPNEDSYAMSALALGSLTANALQPEVKTAAVDKISGMYRDQPSGARRELAISAMGNAKDPQFLPAIFAETTSEVVALRSSAVLSLRHYQSPEVYQKMRSILADGDSLVRRSGLDALRFHYKSAEALKLVIEQYDRESDSSNRMLVLSIAASRFRDNVIGVRSLLELAVEHDSSAEVRKTAREMLALMVI